MQDRQLVAGLAGFLNRFAAAPDTGVVPADLPFPADSDNLEALYGFYALFNSRHLSEPASATMQARVAAGELTAQLAAAHPDLKADWLRRGEAEAARALRGASEAVAAELLIRAAMSGLAAFDLSPSDPDVARSASRTADNAALIADSDSGRPAEMAARLARSMRRVPTAAGGRARRAAVGTARKAAGAAVAAALGVGAEALARASDALLGPIPTPSVICPGPLWNAGWHYQWEGDWAAPAPSMRLQAHPGGPSLTVAADKGGGFTVAADIGSRWKTPADRDEAAALWEHAIGEGAASRHDTAAEAESDAARLSPLFRSWLWALDVAAGLRPPPPLGHRLP